MMLPPDDQNESLFGALENIFKSMVKLVYDPQIIDRCPEQTFTAMFYEIDSEKFTEAKFEQVKVIYNYLENVQKSLQKQYHRWEPRKFNQVTHFFSIIRFLSESLL